MELSPLASNTNPFRFSSMYWDWETETYMTPNRHFNPRTGRWLSPDPFFHALHGNLQSCILQAGNLYVFVTNNPVMFIDPWGLYRVNFVDYLRAQGATVTSIAPRDGRERVSVTVDGVTSNWFLNSGYMQDYTINARFGFSSFLTDSQRDAGFGIAIVGDNLYLNVTDTVISRMHNTISAGRWRPDVLFWFYRQMNHGGAWDIKVESSWNATLGRNTFPGHDTVVYFWGMLVTPPLLGNFTYGYIGRGVGFPLWMLSGGSLFAEFTDNSFNPFLVFEAQNMAYEMRGQIFTALGYSFHRNNTTSILGRPR